jgi:hypothetical protein
MASNQPGQDESLVSLSTQPAACLLASKQSYIQIFQ